MKRFLPFAVIGVIAILGLAFAMRRRGRGTEETFEEMVSAGVA